LAPPRAILMTTNSISFPLKTGNSKRVFGNAGKPWIVYEKYF
jgi:hypothetical protein